MTIKEILNADWTVGWIDVTVRDKKTTKWISGYLIGRDVEPPKHARFVDEMKIGDIYRDGDRKIVVIKRNIQYRWQENKPKGKEACVGVLNENIPDELLNLTVEHMKPDDYGCLSEMHGYYIDCYVDFWNGVTGEYEQTTLTDFLEVLP